MLLLNLTTPLKNKLLYSLLVTSALVVGCSDGDDNNNSTISNTELFQQVLATVGGKDALTQAATISYQSSGESFEFQENPEPVGGKVNDARYSLVYSLDGVRSRQQWQLDAEYAYEAHPDFVETIDQIRERVGPSQLIET